MALIKNLIYYLSMERGKGPGEKLNDGKGGLTQPIFNSAFVLLVTARLKCFGVTRITGVEGEVIKQFGPKMRQRVLC